MLSIGVWIRGIGMPSVVMEMYKNLQKSWRMEDDMQMQAENIVIRIGRIGLGGELSLQ